MSDVVAARGFIPKLGSLKRFTFVDVVLWALRIGVVVVVVGGTIGTLIKGRYGITQWFDFLAFGLTITATTVLRLHWNIARGGVDGHRNQKTCISTSSGAKYLPMVVNPVTRRHDDRASPDLSLGLQLPRESQSPSPTSSSPTYSPAKVCVTHTQCLFQRMPLLRLTQRSSKCLGYSNGAGRGGRARGEVV